MCEERRVCCVSGCVFLSHDKHAFYIESFYIATFNTLYSIYLKVTINCGY